MEARAILYDTNFRTEVYEEDELTWEQHNEIHRALNIAYHFRTQSFVKKTFGYCLPIKRVLAYYDDKLVGHIAVFIDHIFVDGERVKIAGLGMSLSLKPMSLLGGVLRRTALNICAQQGFDFALGRIRNNMRTREHMASFVWCFLELPLIGKTTRSHEDEIVAVFDTKRFRQCPDWLISQACKQGFIKIEDEIF